MALSACRAKTPREAVTSAAGPAKPIERIKTGLGSASPAKNGDALNGLPTKAFVKNRRWYYRCKQ